MTGIASLLAERIARYRDNHPDEAARLDRSEYSKKWAAGVECFRIEINRERKADGMKALPFVAVRSKVAHIEDIDDLRWFFRKCREYARKDKDSTFSKCFFGALKVRSRPLPKRPG